MRNCLVWARTIPGVPIQNLLFVCPSTCIWYKVKNLVYFGYNATRMLLMFDSGWQIDQNDNLPPKSIYRKFIHPDYLSGAKFCLSNGMCG